MTICDIDHLHKRFLDIWEWCMRQGFDTRAFTYVENAFKSEPTAEVADRKTELQIDCQDCKYVWWNSEAKRYECQIEKCPYSQKTENSSEKPNNCEHITEDGVTCAKYPACDDCIDNPLNKVKGSERLVKGSERSSE